MSFQVVHVRVNDAATGRPTPCRIRFATPDGHYLPPLGRGPVGAPEPGDSGGGTLRLGDKDYAYIDGGCEIRLPAGPLAIEISKGPEYVPERRTIERRQGQIALRFSIARRLNLQGAGWFAGDVRAHGLSPPAAWLEGAAEGLQVVNILAAQWRRAGREHADNLLEFSGQEPALVKEECIVAVNTFHRGGALGDLALLHCHRIVFPLTLDQEGFEDWTLLDWCGQCHRKKGLVVWPAFDGLHGELAADLILGGIDALECTDLQRFASRGLEAWYGLLDLGFRVPLVGGSGKTDAGTALGSVRTYAQLAADQPFTYGNWIEAIRQGRTLVTAGPLLSFTIHGCRSETGSDPEEGSFPRTCRVEADSNTPFERLELIHNGQVVAEGTAESGCKASLAYETDSRATGWWAARCQGVEGLLAHTSPVYLSKPPCPVSSPSAALPLFDHLVRMEQWARMNATSDGQREHLLASFSKARSLLEQRLAQA